MRTPEPSFSRILAEAEAVQDTVLLSGRRLSGRRPVTASATTAWRDAWAGLCRGANLLMSGDAERLARGAIQQRRIPRP